MENKKGHINLITVLVFLAVLVGFVALGQALQNTPYLSNLPSLYLIGQNGTLISAQNTTLVFYQNLTDKTPFTHANISLIKSGKILNSTNLQNSTSFNLISSHFFSFKQVGDYALRLNFSGVNYSNSLIEWRNFSVVQAYLTFNNSQVKTGDKIGVSIVMNYPPSINSNYQQIIEINFGDGNTGYVGPTNYTATYTYSKAVESEIFAGVSFYKDGKFFNFNISKPITVTASVKDTTPPKVALINPTQGQIINSSAINFSYVPTDNRGIANCSFYLYGPNNNSMYGTPITDHPQNNSVMMHPFANFSNGRYSWDVVCYDPSGNYLDASGNKGVTDFTVSDTAGDYPHESQIRQASGMLSNFTNQSLSYSPEQINALSDLGIMSNLTGLHGFAEQLNNIKQFFETNQSGFISNLNLRQKTISGEINELNYILSHIPQKVTVSDNQNFVKNSITRNMLGIANSFEISNGVILNEGEISNLALRNENLQRYITVSTNSRNVEVVYSNSTKDMTLVTKQIKITNSSYDAILEAFPENMSSGVTFLTSKNGFQVERINATIYEISQNYLNDTGGLLVYYITPPVDPSVITQSDTVLFKNFPASSLSITGFSILGLDGGSQTNYFIVPVVILLFIYAGVKIKKKVNLSKWKKDGNVVKVIEEIDRAKRALKNDNNTELAKESYHSIKNVFLLTPRGFRDYSRDEIDRIRKGIDRRDIINFVKEYEKAKMQGRKIDSERLYREIKMTYKRLPKKDQEKVYTKVFGSEWEL